MPTVRRSVSIISWCALLFTIMTVPLLDVGLYENADILQPPGERQGSHRDHNHGICIQFFANASLLADPIQLTANRLVLHLESKVGPFSVATITAPPCQARSPPLL